MAKSLSLVPTTLCLILLVLALGLATSARILDQVDLEALITDPTQDLPALPPLGDPTTTLPSGQAPITIAASDDAPTLEEAGNPQPNPVAAVAPSQDETNHPQPNPAAAVAPSQDEADQPQPNPTTAVAPSQDDVDQPQPNPMITTTPSSSAQATSGPEHPAISFYMHDVLGGSQASGRIVTGIVATTDVNGIPFSKPNNQVFPVTNGVPLTNNGNLNNLINNNNAPFLASLNGRSPNNIIQNAGTNSVVNGNNNNQPFVTPGQLPTGATLQKLMFGSITVFDDELTEGHELGSAVIGKGQGFYLASSLDGESHTMAFTTLFHGGENDVDDTVSFFGVHRTASPISQLAIVGGTGKYDNAKGYATIETLPQEDQHTTDGVDTIAHLNVYLY